MNKKEFDEALKKRMKECEEKDIFNRATRLLSTIREEARREERGFKMDNRPLCSLCTQLGVRIENSDEVVEIDPTANGILIEVRPRFKSSPNLARRVFHAYSSGFIDDGRAINILRNVVVQVILVDVYIPGTWEKLLDFDVEKIKTERALFESRRPEREKKSQENRPLTPDEIETARNFGLL